MAIIHDHKMEFICIFSTRLRARTSYTVAICRMHFIRLRNNSKTEVGQSDRLYKSDAFEKQ